MSLKAHNKDVLKVFVLFFYNVFLCYALKSVFGYLGTELFH